MSDAKKAGPRAVLTLKLMCYSLVVEFLFLFFFFFVIFLMSFQYLPINQNKPELILISWNLKMSNIQLFMPEDQDLISLAGSGPIKAVGSTLLMTDMAIVGQKQAPD